MAREAPSRLLEHCYSACERAVKAAGGKAKPGLDGLAKQVLFHAGVIYANSFANLSGSI